MIQFAPELFTAAPAATVDAWLTSSPPLTPLPLLPALLRATGPNSSIALDPLDPHNNHNSDNESSGVAVCQREAIRYLQASVARGAQPVAVHNLLLSLLAAGDDTAALLRCVLDTVAVRQTPCCGPRYLIALHLDPKCKPTIERTVGRAETSRWRAQWTRPMG